MTGAVGPRLSLACRWVGAVSLCLALFPAPALRGNPAILAEDPQLLHETWERQVNEGLLADAEKTLRQLGDLLDAEPEWDPTGRFRGRIALAAEDRLRRLRSVERDLARLLTESVSGLAPPEADDELSGAGSLQNWVTEELQRFRAERDAIVDRLPRPADRDAIRHAGPYERSERFLDEDLLSMVAKTFDARLAALLDADERMRILKARLDDIKREAVQSTEDVYRLERELRKATQRSQDVFAAMFDAEDPTGARFPEGDIVGPEQIGGAFSRLLHHRVIELRVHARRFALDRRTLLEEVRRYRRINDASVHNGFITDQSVAIAAMERAIDELSTCRSLDGNTASVDEDCPTASGGD